MIGNRRSCKGWLVALLAACMLLTGCTKDTDSVPTGEPPEETGTAVTAESETAEMTEPETTEPEDVDTTEPETTEPEDADATEPEATEPTEPETTVPTEPQATEPTAGSEEENGIELPDHDWE